MKTANLPLLAIGIGVLLILLAWIWPRMVATIVWSDRQAREYAEASFEMHELAHDHAHAAAGHGDQRRHDAEALKAAQRCKRLKAELQRAQSRRRGPAVFFGWVGVFCLTAGVVGYYVRRSMAA